MSINRNKLLLRWVCRIFKKKTIVFFIYKDYLQQKILLAVNDGATRTSDMQESGQTAIELSIFKLVFFSLASCTAPAIGLSASLFSGQTGWLDFFYYNSSRFPWKKPEQMLLLTVGLLLCSCLVGVATQRNHSHKHHGYFGFTHFWKGGFFSRHIWPAYWLSCVFPGYLN